MPPSEQATDTAEISLQPGEHILLTLRRHWVLLARDAIGTGLIGIIPLLLVRIMSSGSFGAFPTFMSIVAAAWLLVAWMALAIIWTNYYLDVWIITDEHIFNIDQVALFDRKVRTVGLDRIQEINVHTKGVFATYFGFGTIEIQTASPSEKSALFEGIPEPERVRALLLAQIEKYEELKDKNRELTITTEDQEKLLHLVGHEVKGYLTKSSAALASIVEGDYGAVPEQLQSMAGSALSETRKGVDTVMNILGGANLAKGTLALDKKPFDVKAAVLSIATSLQGSARAKGLTYDLFAGEGTYTVTGDEMKLRDNVFRNLIDNAVRYTPSGSIRMDLTKAGTVIRFAVKDSGVGISPDDMKKLFTEGGKGEHSQEVNKDSTGFGLSIAKRIVEAHGGRIWAESAGTGQGSRFIVELPTAE